jgi:hypothetical protein
MIEKPKDDSSNPTANQNCDDVSDFPNLGPSASQSQSFMMFQTLAIKAY